MNKNPTDATVCRYLFTEKLLYTFRVSQHPSSGVLKTVPAASGTGHTTCTATPLLCGLIWTGLSCRLVLQWINICILLLLLDFYSNWIMMHGITSLKFTSLRSVVLWQRVLCIVWVVYCSEWAWLWMCVVWRIAWDWSKHVAAFQVF